MVGGTKVIAKPFRQHEILAVVLECLVAKDCADALGLARTPVDYQTFIPHGDSE
jgi:hypothetical protein